MPTHLEKYDSGASEICFENVGKCVYQGVYISVFFLGLLFLKMMNRRNFETLDFEDIAI